MTSKLPLELTPQTSTPSSAIYVGNVTLLRLERSGVLLYRRFLAAPFLVGQKSRRKRFTRLIWFPLTFVINKIAQLCGSVDLLLRPPERSHFLSRHLDNVLVWSWRSDNSAFGGAFRHVMGVADSNYLTLVFTLFLTAWGIYEEAHLCSYCLHISCCLQLWW